MEDASVARFLGWFGIGLGIAELLAPAAVARASGLSGRERTLRWFGLREIASGIVILAARDPARWLWLRTAGDALDSGVLAAASRAGRPDRSRAMLATLAVSPVVVLDTIYTARAVSRR
ncbi:MAG: hypothetical protein INR65_06935 [Gluconacetobacter diazotrophicus]|nr:hypothetical protein [Gluconacetobacter diazotrophicus]